jgi:hypothetical protein
MFRRVVVLLGGLLFGDDVLLSSMQVRQRPMNDPAGRPGSPGRQGTAGCLDPGQPDRGVVLSRTTPLRADTTVIPANVAYRPTAGCWPKRSASWCGPPAGYTPRAGLPAPDDRPAAGGRPAGPRSHRQAARPPEGGPEESSTAGRASRRPPAHTPPIPGAPSARRRDPDSAHTCPGLVYTCFGQYGRRNGSPHSRAWRPSSVHRTRKIAGQASGRRGQ